MSAKLTTKAEQQVTVPGTDAHLDLFGLSAQIAMELAAGLSDAAAVRERYGIDSAQWDVLRKNSIFRDMLREAIQKLRGDLNAGKRITLKAEIALEDSLEQLYLMAHDAQIPAASRVESVKTLAALAGRNMKGENAPQGTNGPGFAINIQINAGDTERIISVEGSGPALLPEPEAV